MSQTPSSLNGESGYLVQRYALNGAQYATIAATPLYALSALRRRQFSMRRLIRYNWIVPILGSGLGLAAGYARTSAEPPSTIASRTVEMRMDRKQVRRDDVFLVGSMIGALVTPALFLRSGGLINGLIGGAGLGGAGGLITYYAQDPGSIEEKLGREGRRAVEHGRQIADLAKDKGKALAHQGEKTVADAREQGREIVERTK